MFYEKDAFLRNQSGTRLLIKFLKLVTKLSPVIPTNAKVLNENAPKPLILGIIISKYDYIVVKLLFKLGLFPITKENVGIVFLDHSIKLTI